MGKSLEQFLQESYISEGVTLEQFVNGFYSDEADNNKLKDILSTSIKESAKPSLSYIKRVILIGEMRFKSLRAVAPKLDYADPTKLHYSITEDKISVDDGEYKFSVTKENAKGSIVICKCGYKDNQIAFLLRELSKFGCILVNDPTEVNVSNDKYLLANRLDSFNIPQPKYVLASSHDIHKGDDSKLEKKLKTLYKKVDDDAKFVCKILNGHGGKGVFKCTKSNIMSVLQCIFAIDKDCKVLIQEFMEIDGGDIRCHVVSYNGKQEIISSTMRKKGDEDFRTNLSLGNQQIDYKLSPEQKKIALDTAKASNLVWCGVDIMPLKNGKNVVVEYNGAPGPPSEIIGDKKQLEKINEEFYKKFIETLDGLC